VPGGPGSTRNAYADFRVTICFRSFSTTTSSQGTGFATSAGVPTHPRDRILQHRREHPERSDFADRLLEGIDRIESEFSGAERERLLALAGRTFERHIRSAQRTDEMRSALTQLRKDHRRLIGILELMSEPSEGRTLH
jgi:hypothetical protein